MTARKGTCQVCGGSYTITAAGMVRMHAGPDGIVGLDHCAGGGNAPAEAVPRNQPPPPPDPPPAPPPAVRALPPEVLGCDHYWSGWTHLPSTDHDFRQCLHCQHVELQQRQPCRLCGAAEAKAFEVPDYGTAYVCTPCLGDLA